MTVRNRNTQTIAGYTNETATGGWFAASPFRRQIPGQEPVAYLTRSPLVQDPYATKQLHQILDLDAFQRAHRLLDLAREIVVNVISDEAIKFIDSVLPGNGMRSEV